jgi:hypothetical protein
MEAHSIIVWVLGPCGCIGQEVARLSLDVAILHGCGHWDCVIAICFQGEAAQVLLRNLSWEEDIANLQNGAKNIRAPLFQNSVTPIIDEIKCSYANLE